MAGGSELLKLNRALHEEEERERKRRALAWRSFERGIRIRRGDDGVDTADGRHVASLAGGDARRAATGTTGLTGRLYRSEPGTLHTLTR